eukprot:3252539-Pyramimonas_sp.AAC.1
MEGGEEDGLTPGGVHDASYRPTQKNRDPAKRGMQAQPGPGQDGKPAGAPPPGPEAPDSQGDSQPLL